MKLNKTKTEIVSDATQAASVAIDCVLHELHDKLHWSVSNALRKAILDGIRESLAVVMSNMYTDQEFEKDIGIGDSDIV